MLKFRLGETKMCGKRGFSLIELLVVVSTIALMTSILVPVATRVTESAKAVRCSSNLNQLGLIFKMYVLDNDYKFMERGAGYSPGAVSWFHSIRKYYDPNGGLLFCPQATKTPMNGGLNPNMAWDNITDLGDHYQGSYGINLYVAQRSDPNFWGTINVDMPSEVPLLMCSQWKDIQPFPSDEPLEYESEVWTSGPYNEMRRPCIKRHAPYSVNVLFLDFSIDRRTIKELWKLKWSRNWPTDYALPVWPDWMADVPEP
jgi:prepilin-type N-terminal cleavage/methylation domain-containing protein